MLNDIESVIPSNDGLPPLHLWNPAFSGDIDIVIKSNGEWWHEGSPIQRQQLVNLFASILRREQDGDYYLVTPNEKWRIQVEDQPLLIVDFDVQHALTEIQQIFVVTNVGRRYLLSGEYPLVIGNASDNSVSADREMVPLVALENNLKARFDRPAYYRLIDLGEFNGDWLEIISDGCRFSIGKL